MIDKPNTKNIPEPNGSNAQGDTPLQSVMDHIELTLDGAEAVDLKTVVEAFGNRAFGPVMVLCGLCMMTPLGMLPGIPPAFGVIVMVFAGQLLFRRKTPWMPEVLRRVKIPASKLLSVQKKVRPFLAKIDSIIRPRILWATTGPAQVVVSLFAILLSLTFFLLGLVPFGVVPSAAIVLLLGLGITARDGLLIIIGLSLSLGVFIGSGSLLIKLITG